MRSSTSSLRFANPPRAPLMYTMSPSAVVPPRASLSTLISKSLTTMAEVWASRQTLLSAHSVWCQKSGSRLTRVSFHIVFTGPSMVKRTEPLSPSERLMGMHVPRASMPRLKLLSCTLNSDPISLSPIFGSMPMVNDWR